MYIYSDTSVYISYIGIILNITTMKILLEKFFLSISNTLKCSVKELFLAANICFLELLIIYGPSAFNILLEMCFLGVLIITHVNKLIVYALLSAFLENGCVIRRIKNNLFVFQLMSIIVKYILKDEVSQDTNEKEVSFIVKIKPSISDIIKRVVCDFFEYTTNTKLSQTIIPKFINIIHQNVFRFIFRL